MDLNYTRVTYDGDLADFDEEKLRGIISKFENAQESNVAEFEKAADTLDGVGESSISEFQDACSDLIGEITQADSFDEVPLTESQLEDCTFSNLREWRDFVADSTDDSDDPVDDDDDGKSFDDMGQEAPVNPDDDDDDSTDFAEEIVSDIAGVTVE